MPQRLYPDSCVINRLTDDQTLERIRTEASAIAEVFDEVATGALEWVVSTAVLLELSRNPHAQKRDDALHLLSLATRIVRPTRAALAVAQRLHQEGYGALDGLHLALAEQADADIFLTVDDRLLRRAAQRPASIRPAVENPINWVRRRKLWLIKR